MFRPRSSLKRLYIVRHGESTYNAAVSRGSSWADPQIFDAQLTARGRQQVRTVLRRQGQVLRGSSAVGCTWLERGVHLDNPVPLPLPLLILQACQLRAELAALNLPPNTLWLTSPLQRAMQTLLLACPSAHLLEKSGGGEGGSSSGSFQENSSAAPNGSGERPPRVMVLQSITEKVGVVYGLRVPPGLRAPCATTLPGTGLHSSGPALYLHVTAAAP